MLKITAAAGLSCLALTGVAAAQTANEDPRDARIRELEARIEALTARVEAIAAQEAQAPAPATPPPVTVSVSNGRPTIQSADGDFRFAVRGLAQFDAAAYDQDDSAPQDLSSGTNFRRARLGFEGTVFGDWNYELTAELGGSGAEESKLLAAWIEYAGLEHLRVRIGAQAPSAGLDDATSSSDLIFLERSAGAELMRGLAAGDGRSAVALIGNGDNWFGSFAVTGAVAGAAASFDEQVGVVGRAAVRPFSGDHHGVHFGANITEVTQLADSSAGAGATNVRLQERPELRVDGTRLVDTGVLTADAVSAYGLEAGVQWRNLLATAETYQVEVERAGLGDAAFGGWHVQAVWSLTGEARRWSSKSGAFASARPVHVFDPAEGHWGAWEVAGRYSVLDLNDNEGAAGLASTLGSPTDIIRGGDQTIATLGLNWRPNSAIRFMLDYQTMEIERLDATGATEIGQDLDAVSMRAQLAF